MSEPTASQDAPAPAAAQGSPELRALVADLEALAKEAAERFAAATDLDALEQLRIDYLGKKGALADLNRRFGAISNEEKPAAGKHLNITKGRITGLEAARREQLERADVERRLKEEALDVTLPGTAAPCGHVHPIVQVAREVEDIFRSLGFRVRESPEIETEWVNFGALNFPDDHPARDMQDTFFAERGKVLRTHTSGNQIRTMTELEPPMAVISTGKVYRCDSDVTHSPMFFQMEGFVVDRNVSMAHLKGTLRAFVHGLYGPKTAIRFRPSFFPFTEPSAEVDIQCVFCGGDGCRVCSNSGWLEVLGCGMIHPNVLRNCGIDPEQWSGFAFGLGIDRIAMLKYGINDIRLLYENDLRFLSQF